MSLNVWQRNIVTESGDVIPDAEIEVFDAGSSSKPDLFSDPDGNSSITNPFNADSNGFARFYVAGGRYDVAINGVVLWEDVALGATQSRDTGTAADQIPTNADLPNSSAVDTPGSLLTTGNLANGSGSGVLRADQDEEITAIWDFNKQNAVLDFMPVAGTSLTLRHDAKENTTPYLNNNLPTGAWVHRYRRGGSSNAENLRAWAITRTDHRNVFCVDAEGRGVCVGEPSGGFIQDAINGQLVYENGNRVVESGSNSDGEWVRFADGTQICTAIREITDSSTNQNFPYPQSFSTVHIALWSPDGGSNNRANIRDCYRQETGSNTKTAMRFSGQETEWRVIHGSAGPDWGTDTVRTAFYAKGEWL